MVAIERRNPETSKRGVICLLVVAVWIGLNLTSARAQEPVRGDALRVAVKPIAPFVLKQGTQLTGFSIDLWQAIAQTLKVETVWVEVKTVGEQLQAVQSGQADV